MDEITNNITWSIDTASTADNITWINTESSTDSDTIYFPTFEYRSWLPYRYEKYHPEWHIIQGYKFQINVMWK